jgi:hypothetical protein
MYIRNFVFVLQMKGSTLYEMMVFDPSHHSMTVDDSARLDFERHHNEKWVPIIDRRS